MRAESVRRQSDRLHRSCILRRVLSHAVTARVLTIQPMQFVHQLRKIFWERNFSRGDSMLTSSPQVAEAHATREGAARRSPTIERERL